MTSAPYSDPLTGVIQFFESMSEISVQQIPELYDTQAQFRDPFNSVSGTPAIQSIFADMFEQLDKPSFAITTAIESGSPETFEGDLTERHQAFVTWDFTFRFKRFKRHQQQHVMGASHLVFSPAGKLSIHHDYWDAAHQLYEQIPVVGIMMRTLRKRLSVS